MFILLKGEKILDTNYSCAYAATLLAYTHTQGSVCTWKTEAEKMNAEQERGEHKVYRKTTTMKEPVTYSEKSTCSF